MELLLEPNQWAILAVIGLIAGFIDAVVGGGGLLSIPTLLTFGVPPHLALGTNKLAACFSSTTSCYTYYKQQLFTPKFWKPAALATLVGAIMGSLLVFLINADWLEKLLPILIILISAYTLISPQAMGGNITQAPTTTSTKSKQISQGLLLGGYDGFAGPGIGAFWTVTSIQLHKLPLLHSCGLARAMTSISNITALVIFSLLGHVNWLLGIWMGLSMMAGAAIGAKSAIRFGIPFIKPLFIVIVIAIAGQLSWSAWS
ncbi:sulfite exporter TauE/SafE family protein [Shewanella intestini]|uniref:Probable membrane transporter protein n=1 Tax=Shewanella intestini TaxID=2017544 RepID=A0ABS5I6B9_9GAMM|nr:MULTISPECIES: sulfite exporter TauE/SafE family protein [Shewanella]MBR9729557.1 sulfite exporter TauE/SafE family protein [Shewanella intestini]MRG35447.1 TSUP family transporter [Shewanella sp. XMDDZSB0408]